MTTSTCRTTPDTTRPARDLRSRPAGRPTLTHGRAAVVDGWRITPLRTPWLGPDLTVERATALYVPALDAGHVFAISEKVAVMITGRSIPISDYAPGRLARLLVRHVRPRPGSRGISVPEKMEYVIRHVGVPRLLLACAATALTRPWGVRGAFYRIAGPVARDLDGGRPPFEHLLFPPLSEAEGSVLCEEISALIGAPVVIADLNDYGGTIRARSLLAPPLDTLARVLRTNPLGQRDTRTPFAVLTPPAGSAH